MLFPKIPWYVEAAPFFEPTEASEHLPNLNGRLLADLNDQVLKFGFVTGFENMRELIMRAPFRFHVTSTTLHPDFGHASIRIGSHTKETPVFIPAGLVCWHDGITVEDVRTAIRETDRRMVEYGFMDPNTGHRSGVYDQHSVGVLPVEDIFRDAETLLRFPPNGLAVNTFTDRFEPVSELTIVKLGCGYRICRKKEALLIKRKDEIRTRIYDDYCRRYNVEDADALNRMPRKRFRKMERRVNIAIATQFAKLQRG